jgi:hypothetical protein
MCILLKMFYQVVVIIQQVEVETVVSVPPKDKLNK